MAKKFNQPDLQQQQRLEQEAQQKKAMEQEAERIRALAEQRGQNERSVMDGLVEGDTAPRALEALAKNSLEVHEWYLRFMVVEKLGRQILLDEGYTQEELQAWLVPYALRDANSYVRRAAIKHLTDLAALGKASSGDAEPVVRQKAVERLFFFETDPKALEALGVVALRDPLAEIRHTAVKRIVDQATIATVAKEDAEPEIRESATQKLTGQEDLAWVLLNDPTVQVRSAAAERMTDVSALVQTATKAKKGRTASAAAPKVDADLDALAADLEG
ncbi:MAG: hypothetical protein FWH26_00490 [Oscillospiraceae bacterium]|nr:hypothetical protein [Oscillospiraceae bacterium]